MGDRPIVTEPHRPTAGPRQQPGDQLHLVRPPPRTRRNYLLPLAFLAVQALFAVWIVGKSGTGDATNGVGPGADLALGVILWIAADVVLCTAYTIYRLARR
jgi:hypothetical protein